MTAAPNTTKVPLSPLALIMITIAAATTASATIGFLVAGARYHAAPASQTTQEPGTRHRRLDNQFDDITAGFAELDRRELDGLEERLRDNDW